MGNVFQPGFRMAGRVLAALVLAAATASANVWLDEDFEDGTFNGWDPNGLAGGPAVTASTGFNVDGQASSVRAFDGLQSWRLVTGENVTVGPEYENPTNGNFQLFQFAVSVAQPFPPPGTTVANFEWRHDQESSATPDPDFFDTTLFVRLESTGSAVNIVAGESTAGGSSSGTVIGTLANGTEWKYVTVMIQKDAANKADPVRFPTMQIGAAPAGEAPQGAHFFVGSTTAALSVDLANPGATGENYQSRDWSFQVLDGGVFLDEV